MRNVGCSGGGGGGQQAAGGGVRGAADVRRAYKAAVVPACGGTKTGPRGRRGARGMSMGQKVRALLTLFFLIKAILMGMFNKPSLMIFIFYSTDPYLLNVPRSLVYCPLLWCSYN